MPSPLYFAQVFLDLAVNSSATFVKDADFYHPAEVSARLFNPSLSLDVKKNRISLN